MKITIIGAGAGNPEYLTEASKNKIINSDLVITTKRLQKDFIRLNKATISKEISEIADYVNTYQGLANNISILVSGDVGFYSIAKKLRFELRDLKPELMNGINSLQAFSAKLGINYDDIKTISVHGRFMRVVPYVCYNKKLFILTGGMYKAHDVIEELISYGLGNVIVSVGENLSYSNERIVTNTAENLKDLVFENLTVLFIKNNDYINWYDRIRDDEFIRGKVPMTKEDIRSLVISTLSISPDDYVADIGGGTGALSVAMARRAFEGMVFSVEKNPEAIEVIKSNREKFKAYNIKLIEANAPDDLELPKITKAFIGGSNKKLKEIVKYLLENNKEVRIAVTAITLETLTEALEVFKSNYFEFEITSVNISKSEYVAGYHMMKAQNPVYIISGGIKRG